MRRMALAWEQVTVASADPRALGTWWKDALRWVVVDDSPQVFEIRPDEHTIPGLLFLEVPEDKDAKNRLHLDLRPDDQAAEVERLIGMGATRVDIGQGDAPWVVLADPEGNEFCVLSASSH